MAYVDTLTEIDRSEWFRWIACAGAVLIAHALVALALSLRSDDAELEAGAPVVLIELAPIAAAPAAPQADLAPGPQQLQPESLERLREETPEQKQTKMERVPDETAAQKPLVALPPPVPEPKKQPEQSRQEPTEAAPAPTAPPSAALPAARPASPPPGRIPRPAAAAVLSWQRSLMAQLERHKRYPAQARGDQGIASLEFRIDRHGHVLSSRIVRSSGSAILDEETLALIQRAQPLPPPPADIPDDQLSFVVPVRYAASTRR
jgi:protein TonB